MNQVLTGKDDLAFVAGFSNSVVRARDFTPDLKQLETGINQLVPVRRNGHLGCVSFAADKLAERPEERHVAKILVVISDGDDNSSGTTLKQAIEHAEKDEVIVYTVSTRYSDSRPQMSDPTGNRADESAREAYGRSFVFPWIGRSLQQKSR